MGWEKIFHPGSLAPLGLRKAGVLERGLVTGGRGWAEDKDVIFRSLSIHN